MEKIIALSIIFYIVKQMGTGVGSQEIVTPINKLVSLTIEDAENSNFDTIMDALEQYGITPRVLFSVRNSRGIQLRSQLPVLREWMQEQIKTEYTMNIEVAFKLLGNVGELLRVAYAGCKGFPCSTPVLKVNSKYQDMIFDSARTSGYFVKTVLRALRYHKYAKRKIERNDITVAYKWMTRCASLADRLVIAADKMVNQSEILKEMTAQAIYETDQNDFSNTQEIKETNQTMNRLNARVSKIHKLLENLLESEREHKADVKNFEKKVKEYEEKHAKAANRKVKINEVCTASVVSKGGIPGIISFGEKVVKTCHTELDKGDVAKQAAELATYENLINGVQQSKIRALELKSNVQQNMTALYGELAASMESLKSDRVTTNELFFARNSLKIAHQTLAIVKTVFLHTLNFWIALSDSAENKGSAGNLAEVFEIAGVQDAEELMEELMESGLNWLTMGKVSSDASRSMIAVRGKVTNVFINLPSYEQARKIVHASTPIIEETQRLINQLVDSFKSTQKELEEAQRVVAKSGEKIEDDTDPNPDDFEDDDIDDDIDNGIDTDY